MGEVPGPIVVGDAPVASSIRIRLLSWGWKERGGFRRVRKLETRLQMLPIQMLLWALNWPANQGTNGRGDLAAREMPQTEQSGLGVWSN